MPLFRSIQVLRAAAAMAVLTFHGVQRAGGGFTIGAAGVDVFFVISGFIMWSVTDAQPALPGRFIVHRLIRTVPLYWAVTLAMVALAQWPGAFPNMATPVRHVVLSLLFIPHADPAGGNFPLLAAGWTLNDEMLFYLIFAATLRLPRLARLLTLSGILLALVLAGWMLQPTRPWQRSYTDPVLLEFAAGTWLGAYRRFQMPRPWALALLALATAVFAIQAWLPDAGSQWRLLVWGTPALLLVAATLGLEGAGSWQFPVKLGAASYGIYLLHGLVVSGCWRMLHSAPTALFLLACLVISATAGLVSFALFEQPLTRALRQLASRSKIAVPQLACDHHAGR